MRRLLVAFLCVISIGFGAAAARAGALVSATWTQSLQGIAITVTNGGATCTDTNPAHVPGAGSITCPSAGLQATGSSTATSYNVGLTMPLFQSQQFTTGGVINIGTMVSLQGTQVVIGNAVSATATQGIQGSVVIGGAMIDMYGMWAQPVGATIVKLPLVVGVDGIVTSTWLFSASTHFMTVDFYGWTPGTLTFAGLTSAFAPRPDVVAMGTFGVTANGGGTVTLVSPSKISIDGPAAQRRVASYATLKLTFVPEPGAWFLLGAGALALLRFGRKP